MNLFEHSVLRAMVIWGLVIAPLASRGQGTPHGARPFQAKNTNLVSFEDKEALAAVKASPNSQVNLTKARYIDGKQSMKWTWKGGPAHLTISRVIRISPVKEKLFGQDAGETFSPWVYATKPLPGKLKFSFGRMGQPIPNCRFEFGLAFTGWRTAWVMFDRDMLGKPVPGMNEIRIETPQGVNQGEIYLDAIVLDELVDARHHYPDRQVPFVNKNGREDHWLPKLKLLELAANPAISRASREESEAVARITDRVRKRFLTTAKKAPRSEVDALLKKVDSYDLHVGPQGLRGRHLSFVARQVVAFPEAERKQLTQQFISLELYLEHMLRIAQAYHGPDRTPNERQRLGDAYVLMARHFVDQGWAEGSALGTVHHLGYEFRDAAPSALLMKDVLAKHGVLEPYSRAISWYFNTNAVFLADGIASNMDYYNTLAMGHLTSILLMPDGPAKAVTLRKFSDTMSRILAHETPGVENGFKSDGTAFHHFGHYPAYAMGAFENGSAVIHFLSRTPFEVSPDGRKNFRRALMTMRLYANPDWGIGFAGRHPLHANALENAGMTRLKDAFVNLALSGEPDSGAPIDSGVLAAALRIWPELKKDPRTQMLGVSSEAIPQGHWTLNYAAAGIHRSGLKTVTLRGFNKDVWSSEIYTKDNRFGRYQSHGSISILNEGGNRASGLSQSGWDWNHIPGTTGVNLPLELLESPSNGSLMQKSQRAFAGSSNLNGRLGIFAIDLFDNRLPGSKGLAALKSAFCFDSRIVCLGSEISSPNEQYPTHTTLFQSLLRKTADPIWVDSSKAVTAFPARIMEPKDQSTVLVDSYGNGYYVPSGQSVMVTRERQRSKNDKTKSPTEGDFGKAYLDHGKAPQGGRYQYAILLGTDIQRMLSFKAEASSKLPPYRVLMQDDKVHAVWDRATETTGIVCFKPMKLLSLDTCPVQSVSRPSLIMIQPQTNGDLNMSVCDPILGIQNGRSQPGQVVVRLAGSWSVSNPNVTAVREENSTILTIRTFAGAPVQIIMNSKP